jgi:ligand-binding SRPBCC domain-containing protein
MGNVALFPLSRFKFLLLYSAIDLEGQGVFTKGTGGHRLMRHRYSIEREQFVPKPLSEVFAFFADAANLEILTPGFLRFRILTPVPVRMAPGTLIDYQIRIAGIPQRWKTLIEVFVTPRRFVDVQVRGPYALWRHRHEFSESVGGTTIRDSVEYEMPFGLLGVIVRELLVRRMLEAIFDYRRAKIEGIFGSDTKGAL